MIDALARDVAYGWRSLAARPGFTIAAVLTLALGIGASTAIFAVADRVLLHPIDLPGVDRMIAIREVSPERPEPFGLSGPAFQQIAASTDLFEDTAAFQSSQLALIRENAPELVWGFEVTPNFFTWLHARASLGRTFTADDVTTAERRPVILSHGFWQRRFGGDPSIVGRTIALSNEPFAPAPGTLLTASDVVGVMPPGFQFPQSTGGSGDFWKAVDLAADKYTRPWDRSVRNWTALATLKPGVTIDQARTALGAIGARNAAEFPQTSKQWTFHAAPLTHLFSSADVRVSLVSLGVAIGAVLLLACANVANLLLTRSESRRREFAIRTAIGAGRGRLIRQLLVESALLSAIGAVVGGVAAFWGVDILAARLPQALPRLEPIGLDWRALAFATGLAGIAAMCFGLIPAWQASRRRTIETLKPLGLSPSRDGRAFRHGLVFSQVALSVLVLFGASLLLQSVTRFLSVNPGYDPQGLVTFMVTHFNIDTPQRVAKLTAMTDAFRGMPGAQSVVVSARGASGSIVAQGRTTPLGVDHMLVGTIDQDFFDTYRIPLMYGRGFDAADAAVRSAGVIVNGTLARALWPNTEAVGQVFTSAQARVPARFEVIGVVGDVIHNPERAPRPAFYEPYERVTTPTMYSLYTIRARTDASSLVPDVRTQLWQLDRLTIPPEMILPENSFRAMVAPRESLLELLGFFAIVATVLTAIGIYGVVAQMVGSRTREIGLRLALGAQRAHVFRLIVGQGGRVIGAGIVTGLIAAPLAGRYLGSKLFGVTPGDAATLIAVGTILGLVGVSACAWPARRAMHVDPSISLRAD